MKYILSGILILTVFASCSSRFGITDAQAYSRKSAAGTLRVNKNGNPAGSGISYQHLVYVETDTAGPVPEWETVWAGGQAHSVRAVGVQPNQVIGKNTDGADVVLHPGRGNRLWQLVLVPKTDSVNGNNSLRRKIEKNPVVITGTWKNKAFAYKIARETQLQPLDMQ